MENVNENNENVKSKKGKNKIMILIIIISVATILTCGAYLANSFLMLKKYDVNSFKLDKYKIPTFNSAIKSKKKLVYASERKGIITLKYDIKKIVLNDVYAYLEKLSSEGYTIVNLEDLYMRVVKKDDDIQVRITVGSNHLVFEYKIGIDYDEPDDSAKAETQAKETETE